MLAKSHFLISQNRSAAIQNIKIFESEQLDNKLDPQQQQNINQKTNKITTHEPALLQEKGMQRQISEIDLVYQMQTNK